MKQISKPENLSKDAFDILMAAYENFETNHTKSFFTSEISGYTRKELETYLNELHENHFVFWEFRNTPDEYIYILFNQLLIEAVLSQYINQ